MVFETYGIGNAQYLMKEFPLIDLFAMLYWKPPISLADFLSAWGNGKDKAGGNTKSSGPVRVIENESLADLDRAMTNSEHPQYAKPK